MRARFLAGLLVPAWLLLAGTARAQGLDPIPQDQLEGKRLVLKDANCSIELPGDDWRFYLRRDPDPLRRRYFCAIPGNQHASFLLTIDIYGENKGPLDADRARTNVDYMKSWLAQTTTPGEFSIEPSTVLLGPGSFRFAGSTVTAEGTKKSIFGYLARPWHQYAVSCITLEGSEPAPFTEFARSLRILGAFEQAKSATSEGPSFGIVALVVLGVVGLLALSVLGFRVQPPEEPKPSAPPA